MTLPIHPQYPPMEAKRVDRIPAGEHWQFEPKWDGFRAIVFRDGDDVEVQSKAGQPLARLEALRSENPFEVRVPGGPSRWASAKSGEWVPVRPELVCEVEYDDYSQGRFRHGFQTGSRSLFARTTGYRPSRLRAQRGCHPERESRDLCGWGDRHEHLMHLPTRSLDPGARDDRFSALPLDVAYRLPLDTCVRLRWAASGGHPRSSGFSLENVPRVAQAG